MKSLAAYPSPSARSRAGFIVHASRLLKRGKHKERIIYLLRQKGRPMNHRPFRDWLLSKEELSVDQAQQLREHIQSCELCNEIETAWSEVESALQKTPPVEPKPGFVNRWQSHLEAYQSRKQRRKGWISICSIIFIVISLIVVLVTQVWALIQAPGPYLVAWFGRMINLLTIFYTVQDMVSPITWNAPVYTFIGMFFLVGIASFMSVLWLATYRKLSLARRLI